MSKHISFSERKKRRRDILGSSTIIYTTQNDEEFRHTLATHKRKKIYIESEDRIDITKMVLLDKIWDDVAAGPQPESGLSKLRKVTTKPSSLNINGTYVIYYYFAS